MFQQFRTAALVLLAMTVLTGGVYPLVVTALAQLAFPARSNGSLIREGNRVVGSELIGQQFTSAGYFWGRLSATGPLPYNAAASSGSNYGPLNSALKEAAEARLQALGAGAAESSRVPVDLVTASGSGLDPHISPAAAEYQVPRIAASRKMSEDDVRALVRRCTQGRQLGLLGEARVNVLVLNLALDTHQKQNQ